MSTAPPGWHRQSDGRDRFWDGQQWTEEFRDPASADTQQIPLDETRGMPAAENPTGYASPAPYGGAPAASGAPGAPYGTPPAGGTPGGPPGYGGQPPQYGPPVAPTQGGNGWLKGCLIALVVLVVLGIALVIGGSWLFTRAVDQLPEIVPTALPTEQPSEVPTDLPEIIPTDLPTGLPTDLPTLTEGESVEAGFGEEFTLAGVTIASGWTVEDLTLGFSSVTMQATVGEDGTVPLLFDIVFFEGDTDVTRTTCTVPPGTTGGTVDVTCVPVRGFADGVDRIRAVTMEVG